MTTEVHDMEVTTANHRSKSFSFTKSKKDKAQFRRNVNFFKNSTKEAMFISKANPGWIMKKPKLEEKRSFPFQDAKRKYTFSDLDLLGILDDLLEKGIIQLPQPMRSKEAGRTTNANIIGIIGCSATLSKSHHA